MASDRIFILIFAIVVGRSTVLADPNAPCADGTPDGAKDVVTASCVSQCNTAFANKNEKMTARIQARCETAMKDKSKRNALEGGSPLTKENVDWFVKKCLKRAGYKALTDLPILAGHAMKALGDNAYKNRMPPGFEGGIRECEKSADCRRSFARNLNAFEKRNADGSWVVSDAEVDKATQGQSLMDVINVGDHQRDASKKDCERRLGKIRGDVIRELQGEDYDVKAQRKVYDSIGTTEPHCLGLLGLYPPELKIDAKPEKKTEPAEKKPEPKKEPGPPIMNESLRRQLLLGDICVGQDDEDSIKNNVVDDEHTTEFCGDMMSLFVPTGAAVKAVKVFAPGAKAVAAESKALNAEVKAASSEARAAETAAGREQISMSANAARAESSAVRTAETAAREKLIASHADRVFASEAQNRAYMKLAEAPPSANTWFVDREIGVLKQLNTAGDKTLATAITNLDKDIFLKHLNDLKAKYPNVKFETYSDFKSVKLAVTEGDGFTAAERAALKRDLDEAVKKSGREFTAEVEKLGVKVPEAGPPDKWVKTAADDTFDGAADKVRAARKEDDVGLFTRDIREERGAQLSQLERERAELSNSPRFNELMDRSDPSSAVPKADVFDLTRKNTTPDSLAQAVRDRYGVSDFSAADAQQLMNYTNKVNEFTPTILIPKREILNLEGAANGGMTADFLGLGSANLHATAKGVAGKTELSSALNGAREGERMVTEQFHRKMDKFKSIAGRDAICTGDDCAQIASNVMSNTEKARMVEKMAKDPDTRKIRMAFFGPDVPSSIRMQISSHGELIEKSLRKELAGKIPAAKLDSLVFGLDMKSTKLNVGDVNLVIGQSGSRLSASETKAIQEAFSKAIDKYNGTVARYQSGSTVLTQRTFYLAPGPSVFTSFDDNR